MKLEPPCYVRVIRVLEKICDGIHHLRADSGIHEAVDLAFVKQQVEAGLYTWARTQKLLASIVSIIEHIEMPKRDGETKTVWEALQAVGNEGEVRPSPLCAISSSFCSIGSTCCASTRPTRASVTWPL